MREYLIYEGDPPPVVYSFYGNSKQEALNQYNNMHGTSYRFCGVVSSGCVRVVDARYYGDYDKVSYAK